MPPDGMTSDIVRSSTYFQWLDSNGVSVARSLIIRRNRIGPSLVPCGTPACTGKPRGYDVLNLNSLASAIKKTANPPDNETTNPEVDEFIDQDSVVDMVKSLTKIQEAGP